MRIIEHNNMILLQTDDDEADDSRRTVLENTIQYFLDCGQSQKEAEKKAQIAMSHEHFPTRGKATEQISKVFQVIREQNPKLIPLLRVLWLEPIGNGEVNLAFYVE